MRGLGLALVLLSFLQLSQGGKMLTPTNAWYKVACIAENIKANDHYICDKNGHILCLPGWENEKHYCRDPICDPPCVAGQGNCTRPNHCECGVGYTGPDCSQCVCLPGCVNGYCETPFECKCEAGWTGMFCDKPICKEGCQHGHCSQPGECICHPGWFGPNCDQCVKLPGCTHNGYCTKPMECKCQPGWTGHFCHKPICRPGCNETTGFCSKPGECWCRVGWTGPKCETCVPYPGCQNGFCEQPWECKCTGDYVGMLCDKLASETTTVQFHPTTLPPLPPQNTGQPFTVIQGPKGQPVYQPYKPSLPTYPQKPVYKPSVPVYPPPQPSYIPPPNKPQPYPQPYPQNPYYAANTALPDFLKGDDGEENVSDTPLDVVSAFDLEV